jgi:hypothetical protein
LSLTIEPVRSGSDRSQFIALPFRLYSQDPFWVPPLRLDMKERLDEKRHPFFTQAKVRLFLARRGPQVAGRVAALVDEAHNRYHDEKAAGFGFLEFEEDQEVAAALLRRVAEWGRAQGMEKLRGPVNFSTNEECGTLVDGFDGPPVLMMTYNPPWHAGILESLGLDKGRDLLAYYIDRSASFDRLKRLSERVVKRYELKGRPIDLKRYDEELEIIRAIYNEAWANNWGFVPMERDEFRWHARKMKQILVPELAMIVEAKGEPIGFSLAMPDYNQALIKLKGRLFPFGLIKFLFLKRRISGIRVMAMGVKSAHRTIGAEGVMISRTIEEGLRLGYGWAELSWVLDDNEAMCKLAENMGARAYRRYRIWEAPIERMLP